MPRPLNDLIDIAEFKRQLRPERLRDTLNHWKEAVADLEPGKGKEIRALYKATYAMADEELTAEKGAELIERFFEFLSTDERRLHLVAVMARGALRPGIDLG